MLALSALGASVAGRVLVSWWGGAPESDLARTPVARAGPASWRRALGFMLILGAVAALAWLPIVSLAASALARSTGEPPGVSMIAFLHRLDRMTSRRLLAISLALGTVVVAIDLTLVRLLRTRQGPRSVLRAMTLWPETAPPLVLGVGALVLPGILLAGADGLVEMGSGASLARGLRWAADRLDPFRTPGLLLVLGVAAARLPMAARAEEAGRAGSRRAMVDAAVTLGARPGRARRLASGGRLGISIGTLALLVALAATSLAPALVLATTSESRPVAPGVLILSDGSGEDRRVAAALATCAIVVNIAAFALASRSRVVPVGEWFRWSA